MASPYADAWYRALKPTGWCHWCGIRKATTRDHRIALSDGGAHHPDNIVFACATCNYGRTSEGRERARPRW